MEVEKPPRWSPDATKDSVGWSNGPSFLLSICLLICLLNRSKTLDCFCFFIFNVGIAFLSIFPLLRPLRSCLRHSDVAAARRLAQHLRGQALSIPASSTAGVAIPAAAAAASPAAAAVYDVAAVGSSSTHAPSSLNVNVNGSSSSAAAAATTAGETNEGPPLDASTPMEVDAPPPPPPAGGVVDASPSAAATEFDEFLSGILPRLSQQLDLETLWESLGACLKELATTSDSHAVLVLQPTVEAFFLGKCVSSGGSVSEWGEKENKVFKLLVTASSL